MTYVNSVDVIIVSSIDTYNDLKKANNSRYRSWEYCYSNFYHARGNEKINVDSDYLSLQLAFYLASWGMYRGSSFLLQKDYKIHIPVVEEILKAKYDSLMGIECKDLRDLNNQVLLSDLNAFISAYYDNIRKDVKGQDLKAELSTTLVTKILMGVMGCVPAYDRYFIAGMKSQKIATSNYSIKSILKLVEFYEKNRETIEPIRKMMLFGDCMYPQMKIVDMIFWKIGFDADIR